MGISFQLIAWRSEVEEAASRATGGPPSSSIIRDFLENAGQKSLLDDLVKVENDFCKAMTKLKLELQASLQVWQLFTFSYNVFNLNQILLK